MRQRLTYLLRFYLSTILVFIVAKMIFMVCNSQGHDFSVSDVCDVIVHGLSLDLSTALYLLIVPFLCTVASIFVGSAKLLRMILNGYYALIAFALALTFVADTSLYEFWQFKLDASCLQYLSTPTEAMASVSTVYIIVRIAVVILLTFLIYCGYAFFKQTILPSRHRIVESLAAIVLIPLMIIGIRGGLDESTTNIGQVYYSQSQFLNHSAVNPFFSFLSSIGKSGDNIVGYNYYDDAQLKQLTQDYYHTQSTNPDTLLATTRPNILFIVMESCGGQFTLLGNDSTIMPRFNRTCTEGIFFSECYANSWRTDKGIVSILSGYPAFPITSVMKIPEKSRKLPSIAATLQTLGYTCSFYYGGDINFTNMRSYVLGSGYQKLRWKADYSRQEQNTSKWGVRDDIMLASLYDDIAAEGDKPWMKTLLTLSSHEPWDVPTKQLDDPVFNAFNYLDICLGDFIDRLRQTPVWENLLMVILPDHGYRYKGVDETTRIYNHIPMLWIGGAVTKPCRVETLCNQSDLAATLLGQMGVAHDKFRFSRDVLSQDYCRHFVYHTFNNGFSVIDTTGFVAYDLDAQKVIANEGTRTEGLLQQGRALLQLTSQDLKEK